MSAFGRFKLQISVHPSQQELLYCSEHLHNMVTFAGFSHLKAPIVNAFSFPQAVEKSESLSVVYKATISELAQIVVILQKV